MVSRHHYPLRCLMLLLPFPFAPTAAAAASSDLGVRVRMVAPATRRVGAFASADRPSEVSTRATQVEVAGGPSWAIGIRRSEMCFADEVADGKPLRLPLVDRLYCRR